MEATVVDLRYKMRDVLKTLNRKEKVKILCHGKTKGIIIPAAGAEKEYREIREHPFFGMSKGRKKTVFEELRSLRGPLA